jgi:hypothetical protein
MRVLKQNRIAVAQERNEREDKFEGDLMRSSFI